MPAIRAIIAIAGALLFLTPETLWAWGPPTHVFLGTQILGDLAMLPVAIREVLAAYPARFLYGNLAPDITQAKEHAPYARHCHNWSVGFEVFDLVDTAELRSFALGYLCHLAADTIAHNVFVPRQLAATPLASHAYWEYRFDTELGDSYLRLAREVVTDDHAEPDALLERAVTIPYFSFRTNKRIYERIVHLSNQERWHNLWTRAADNSKWSWPADSTDRYIELSIAYMRDLLGYGAESLPHRLDPVGRERLAAARRLRRRTFREARRSAGRDLAGSPISDVTIEDAKRFLTTRPVARREIEQVARASFPEPDWPGRSAISRAAESDRFWETFREEPRQDRDRRAV